MPRVLVATKDGETSLSFEKCFSDDEVVVISERQECIDNIRATRFDYCFVDIDLLLPSGAVEGNLKQALRPFRSTRPGCHLIVLTPQHRIREAVRTVKAGASDYLNYPIDPAEVRLVTENINEADLKDLELEYLRDQFWQSDSLEILKTNSQKMKTVLKSVKSVAPTKTSVLLTGESGTGKGVIAQLIHRHSNRSDNQFISVHCGAIPDTLIESELFGHERGAFTGAHRRKLGKFEIAQKGTIFLDEIGTVTPAVQIKLLQVLQDKIFHRVGGDSAIESDVRVIAATNADFKSLVDNGTFRQDLYYRLNVFPIELPPLRERPEDIALLSNTILDNLNKAHEKQIEELHPDVVAALEGYSWPGNIRELENVLERAYILETSDVLSPESLPSELIDSISLPQAQIAVDANLTLAEFRKKGVEDLERRYLKELLTRHKGRINRSSEEAGVSARQLHKLLTKYGIRKEEFKSK